ncbi:MAG: hypothetical protein KH452_04180 [Clostridiales bacterium]|nr:hypothetical protein [Clostridiales bacterium]
MEEKQLAFHRDATEKLFYRDSHQWEFTASVLSCEKSKKGYRIVLDRTAFFPEGGGQFGDRGWLNEVRVLDTHEKDGVVYHETGEPIEAGTQVEGKLDEKERFSRMQQHSGEHILSGIVHGLFGYDNVGFHLGAEVTTLDFNGELNEEQVREAEDRANAAVFADIPVQVLYPDPKELQQMDYRSKIEIEGQVRIVAVPGYDMCACCAPHVDRTGEIGMIRILSCEKHRGGCRMTIVCGMRALEDYRRKQQSVGEVSVALSAKPEEIGSAVLHLKEQQAKIREQLNRMQEVYLQQKLTEICPGDRNVCIFEEEMDHIAVRNFVNGAMERCEGICGAFVGTDESGYRYILGSRTVDLRTFSRELNSRFQGKGGGRPEMVQGSLTGREQEIREMICGQ